MPDQAAYDVTYYDLHLKIDPESRSISGFIVVEALVLNPIVVFVLDLNMNFTVDSVLWKHNQDDLALPYFHLREEPNSQEGKLWILFPDVVLAGEKVCMRVHYRGNPKFHWRKTLDHQHWIGVSCEAEGGDQWWPCKDQPSDEPDSVTLHFTVPESLVCVSNGKLLNVCDNDDHTRTFHWFVSNPINNYNVTFCLAPYQTIEYSYQSVTGESLPVTIWVLPESRDRAESHTPQFLDHLRFLEEMCGPYPFRADKYGVAEVPYMGMEHQTIIAYGFSYENASCGFDWLHLHELSHEWWGNMVTARDWSDAWIHEGFASYMEALYAERLGGMNDYRDYLLDKVLWLNTKPVAPRKSVTMNEAFETGDIYYKAAWVIHTLRYYLGDELFFTLLHRWAYPDPVLETITNGDQCRFATTEDFIRIAEEVTDREIDWFFEVYLRQASLPTLKVTMENLRLCLSWQIENDISFYLPVEVKVDDSIVHVDMKDGMGVVEIPEGVDPEIDPHHWILMNPVSIEGTEGWMIQNSGTIDWLYGIHFPNKTMGCTVGRHGTILMTKDAGSNWVTQLSGTSEHLNSVHFANSLLGWTVGNNGIILKTTDGGTSWIDLISGTGLWLISTQFIDTEVGWVVGQSGLILKTTNGGTRWFSQYSGTSDPLRSVHFTDIYTGWIVGDNGIILHTSNGGRYWYRQNSGTSDHLRSVCFIDSIAGCVVGDGGSILKTRDGGNTWVPLSRITSKHLRSVHFADEKRGWVVGDNGTILCSSDSSTTWVSRVSGTVYDLKSVYFPDTEVGWAAGSNGTILMKTGGGKTVVDDGYPSNMIDVDPCILFQNFPNPFNVSTTFRFHLMESCSIRLKVYNLLGDEVATLIEGKRIPGEYEFIWTAGNLPSGIYICRLETGDFLKGSRQRIVETRKIILQK